MGDRLQLHASFLLICDNVYFQPPPNLKMKYPAIIYRRDDNQPEYADNLPYRLTTRYLVTVVDRNPDSGIPKQIAMMRTSRFDRFYTDGDLNHDVYKLFF